MSLLIIYVAMSVISVYRILVSLMSYVIFILNCDNIGYRCQKQVLDMDMNNAVNKYTHPIK